MYNPLKHNILSVSLPDYTMLHIVKTEVTYGQNIKSNMPSQPAMHYIVHGRV